MGAIPVNEDKPQDEPEVQAAQPETPVPVPVPEMPRILDFADVIRGLKNGRRFARSGWSGQGMFIEMQVPDSGSKMTLPYAFLVYTVLQPDGNRSIGGVVPWMCPQMDMFANDWIEITVTQTAPTPAVDPIMEAPEEDTEDE